jgi:hypothetical protein
MDNTAKAFPHIIKQKGDSAELFCSKCKASRKMYIRPVHQTMLQLYYKLALDAQGGMGMVTIRSTDEYVKDITPSLWICNCKQCDALHIVIIYPSNNESSLLILSEFGNGVATENTPKQVAYYVEQAYKCESIGANSACVAMYRAALENLLFEQGFKMKLLQPKIDALDKAISEKNAPGWAYKINPEVLKYMKELGNDSIHPNNGDIDKQKIIDDQLIMSITYFMSILVDFVYEQPSRERQVAEALRGAVTAFKEK